LGAPPPCAPLAVRSPVDATFSATCHRPAAANEAALRKALPNAGAFRRGTTRDGQGVASAGSAMGTVVESSSVGSMTTELTTSPVGGAVGCAALIVATLALCGTWGAAAAAGAGGGAAGVPTVSAGGVTVVSPGDEAAASDPAATPSLLGGASVAVDVSGDVTHVPVVVVVVAVSTPSVVLPDEATVSVAPGVHEVSVAAIEVSVAAPVLSADVAAPVLSADVAAPVLSADVAAPVLSAEVVVSVEDNDVSVDEVELAVSGSVAVTSEGVSDAPAVVSAVCALPVTAGVVVVVLTSTEVAEGATVSSSCPDGRGTSSALAGAIQVEVEATPTLKTAVQRISRSSRRR
jgi:hypothetical protein